MSPPRSSVSVALLHASASEWGVRTQDEADRLSAQVATLANAQLAESQIRSRIEPLIVGNAQAARTLTLILDAIANRRMG